MAFSKAEHEALLSVKGVGPKVISRLEEMGIDSFKSLARASALDVVTHGADITGSTCWKNSPQARAAIDAAIARAKKPLSNTDV